MISLGGLPLLYFLQFDFNPINLRSPKVESIATYLDLRNDPNAGANGINVLTRDLEDARQTAERLRKVPEVNRVMTLDTFIPNDQDAKLAHIQGLAKALEPALNAKPAPCPVGRGEYRRTQSRRRRLDQEPQAIRPGPAPRQRSGWQPC